MRDSATLTGHNFSDTLTAATPDASKLKKCVASVEAALNPEILSAEIAQRYAEKDWRELRASIKTSSAEIVAILNRNGDCVIYGNDAETLEKSRQLNPDEIFRHGFLVSANGKIAERLFLRSGRMVLTAEESSAVDLGPCDPDL